MLQPRIMPCLLIHDSGLVKTENFKKPKYIGDPINAVRIFNEKEVDELIVLDIDATNNSTEPNFKMIEILASECRMPLCYGGGIKNIEQAKKIISLGVEKVALSSAAIENPNLINEISNEIGRQSVVVVIDVKKKKFSKKYDVFINNGNKKSKVCLEEFVPLIEKLGAGEVVINSIDRDGTMQGYDISFAKFIRELTSLPITVLGGAGSLSDVSSLIKELGIIGAAVGSLFVFKGKYKAVLINYPDRNIKEKIILDSKIYF